MKQQPKCPNDDTEMQYISETDELYCSECGLFISVGELNAEVEDYNEDLLKEVLNN